MRREYIKNLNTLNWSKRKYINGRDTWLQEPAWEGCKQFLDQSSCLQQKPTFNNIRIIPIKPRHNSVHSTFRYPEMKKWKNQDSCLPSLVGPSAGEGAVPWPKPNSKSAKNMKPMMGRACNLMELIFRTDNDLTLV